MSGIVLTGKLNSIPFHPVDLARGLSFPPGNLIVPPGGEKNQESFKPFAPLDTRRQMGK